MDTTSGLRRRKRGEFGMLFAGRTSPLHAMLASCGHVVETRTSYDLHGLRRGEANVAMMQYTIDGFGMLSCQGREYRMTSGKAMLLHFPYDNRYWLPADSDRWEFLYVSLRGSEALRLWRDITAKQGPVVDLSPSTPSVRLLADIVEKMLNGRIATPFEASALAYELVMKVAEHVAAKPPPEEQPGCVVKAREFCREHFREAIGVDEIAKVAGYSRYHFSRLFKEWTGHSPAEYVTYLRAEHAAELLSTTNLTVKEVSDQSGFKDCNYFCRCFRKLVGQSPGEYRQSGVF